MINLIIAYDDTEQNFSRLAGNIKTTFISNPNYKVIEIKHPNLNVSNVNTILSSIGDSEIFVFVAYSHGLKDSLLQIKNSTSTYVNTSTSTHFRNSIFYTFSCLTGHILADSLIKNGALAYFGYKGEVYIIDEPKYISSNVNIVNSGLIKLLKNNSFNHQAFEDSFNAILDTYDLYIETTDVLDYAKRWAVNQRLLILR